eukprot:379348_1
MGNICSQIRCTSTTCHCFIYDRNVQTQSVVKKIKSKWIWTNNHQLTLLQTLSYSVYNVPVELTLLIKDYAYNANIDHNVTIPAMCEQHYYSNQRALSSKHLCKTWYRSQMSAASTFSIQINALNTLNSINLFQSFNEYHLPSLTPSYSSSNDDTCIDSFRTVNINHCPIRIRLFEKIKGDKAANICFHLFTKKDSVDDIDSICNNLMKQSELMSNCMDILVNIVRNKTCKVDNKISRKFSIPVINLDPTDQKSVENLFILAIKYYWFFSTHI